MVVEGFTRREVLVNDSSMIYNGARELAFSFTNIIRPLHRMLQIVLSSSTLDIFHDFKIAGHVFIVHLMIVCPMQLCCQGFLFPLLTSGSSIL